MHTFLHRNFPQRKNSGFALVAVITVMVLVACVVFGLLSLSTISLRSGQRAEAHARAQTNARLALIMALGQLQSQAGQDPRITASASLLDADASTPDVDGIAQPNWLGVWDSWGAWLNSRYQRENGQTLSIQDTYQQGRQPMFRRWLVSGIAQDQFDAPKNGSFGSAGSVVVVAADANQSSRETRAGLVPVSVSQQGQFAWWVGGENQKADVSVSSNPVERTAPQTEAARGDAMIRRFAEVEGMQNLTRDPEVAKKYATTAQVALAGADRAQISKRFHDLTAYSSGLLTDVRWGGLKKDLSLLFEPNSLPIEFSRNTINAPSPRPLSSDLASYGPKIPERPFTSFEQFKTYAQKYRTGGDNSLSWTGTAPSAPPRNERTLNDPQMTTYWQMPVIAKQYCIYNLQTAENGVDGTGAKTYDCFLTYSPVIQLWNPYNVPLTVPSNLIQAFLMPYKVLPIRYRKYQGSAPDGGWIGADQNNSFGQDHTFPVRDESGGTIRFEPGEFLIFSLRASSTGGVTQSAPVLPGFDPGAVCVSRFKIYSKVTATSNPGLAIQAQPWWNNDGMAWWFGGNPGAFCNVPYMNNAHAAFGTGIDWFDAATDYSMIAPEASSLLAHWNFADTEPVPIGAVGAVMKTSEKLSYDVTWPGDWRSRTWAQSPPWFAYEQMLANYTNPNVLALQRLNCSMQIHFRHLSGMSELAELIPNLGKHGFMGSGTTAGEKITTAAVAELPTAPVQSLAGFAGMRLQPGWFNYGARQTGQQGNANDFWLAKVVSYRSGVPGVGIGNSLAQPMIPADKVYAYHDISKNAPASDIGPNGKARAQTDSNAFSDFWDHLLLVNDGLWDSWFLSSLSDARRPSDTGAPALSELLSSTFKDLKPLPNANFVPAQNQASSSIINDLSKPDGYLRAAEYLFNRGAFNVNSTSEDAWFALFSSLRDHPLVYREANGNLKKESPPQGMAVVSRFQTETTAAESDDPRTGAAINGQPSWSGVRYLGEEQLRRLARECVVQVKQRGPFLNLSDFINRRLAAGDMGRRGALQAAIDYDDESPDTKSINYRYKQIADDRITSADYGYANYPFPDAAKGSRFTAAPGYVVQSDLLRPLGNAMTVRDDTFVVRAYGDARDRQGNIIARAWCEATIQRIPDYVDPTNAPSVSPTQLDPNGNPSANSAFTVLNQRFGRKFRLTSFRWLSPQSI